MSPLQQHTSPSTQLKVDQRQRSDRWQRERVFLDSKDVLDERLKGLGEVRLDQRDNARELDGSG